MISIWSKLSLKTKLTVLVVTVVAVACWLAGRFAFSGLLGILERSLGMQAQTAAEAIAVSVDGNELLPGASLSPKLRRGLDHLITQGRIEQIEIIRPGRETGQPETVLRTPIMQPDPFGTSESLKLSESYLFKQEPGYGGIERVHRVYMGGWAPVFLPNGALSGQVIVAIDPTEVQNALDTAHVAIGMTMFAFILLSGLIAFKFSATFEKAAVTDGLMGIYNHKYFKQRIEEEVARSKRYGQQTSLVLFDIDFFKRVNDTYGHATGDLVLKLMAKWVTEMCRTTDVVCRYGGEEIACILSHTGIAGAQEFAERLRLKIAQQVVRDPEEDAEFRVTVSVGVAQWQKGMGFMDMIRAADAALYHSKGAGRNRVTVYHEELLPAPDGMASKPERTKEQRL